MSLCHYVDRTGRVCGQPLDYIDHHDWAMSKHHHCFRTPDAKAPWWAHVSETPLPEPELREAVFGAVLQHCENDEEYAAGCMEDVMHEVVPVVASLRAELAALRAEQRQYRIEALQAVAAIIRDQTKQVVASGGHWTVDDILKGLDDIIAAQSQ